MGGAGCAGDLNFLSAPARARAELEVHSGFLRRALQLVSHSADREMVEGPGCTLNGEKIRARVRPGQAVTDLRGSALQSLGVVSSQVSR